MTKLNLACKGFAFIPLLIIGVILTVSAVAFFILKPSLQDSSGIFQQVQKKLKKSGGNDQPPLLLKSIGIDLNYYDSATSKAGAFVFSKEFLVGFEQPFMGFGYEIPAKFSATGKIKANPQPTFILPLGTPVFSLVDGIVAATPQLYSGDYSVQVNENGKMETWIYETEHVINLKVSVGDSVKVGQVVGEVSDFNKNLGKFGLVEIGILKGSSTPQHVCPFAYLDPSIKEETFLKIKSLYQGWEQYIGNTNLYDESEPLTGCVKLDSVEG